MEPQALDYAEALARLVELVGRPVEVTILGVGSKPPILLLDLEGVLQQTDQIEEAETLAWHPMPFASG
jgi:hypothetical protein